MPRESEPPRSTPSTGDFVQLMISAQSRLYAFLLSLVCDPEQASEVLQETNVVLWEKSEQFQLGTNFMAWAFQIARYQLMAHRQRQGRDRHIFDDDTLADVADAFQQHSDDFDDRMIALSHCLNQLPNEGQRLIEHRYSKGFSVKSIAEQLGQKANRVAVRLHRLRVSLMQCIQMRIQAQARMNEA